MDRRGWAIANTRIKYCSFKGTCKITLGCTRPEAYDLTDNYSVVPNAIAAGTPQLGDGVSIARVERFENTDTVSLQQSSQNLHQALG